MAPYGGVNPGPGGGWPPTQPRKSHVGLIIGLVGGFCALVLIGCAIGGYILWQRHETSQRHSDERATLAIYHRIGRPTGFTEQGSPRLRTPTWLSVTWTAPSGQGDPVNATAAWLGQHMKATPPNSEDVRRVYRDHGPFFLDDQPAQSIQVTLSRTTSTYQINVSIIR
ncbi:hypothetical protein [Actinomadura yumaensis]|uniref:Uncharacterized protein n=1 Tax=Actinomadura yumaensis TaxID=111807 RepID=A0ABW2CJR0_9ACTN